MKLKAENKKDILEDIVLEIPDRLWHKSDKAAVLNAFDDLTKFLGSDFAPAYANGVMPTVSGWYVKMIDGSEVAVPVRRYFNDLVYDFGGLTNVVANDGSWVRFLVAEDL